MLFQVSLIVNQGKRGRYSRRVEIRLRPENRFEQEGEAPRQVIAQ